MTDIYLTPAWFSLGELMHAKGTCKVIGDSLSQSFSSEHTKSRLTIK